LLSNHASLLFPPPTDWKGASASINLHNASPITSLATTPSSAPSSLPAASVPNHTPLGITPAPLPPVQQETAYAHILHLYVPTAVVLMKHTLPPAANTLPLSPVKGMRLRMRPRWWALRGTVCLGESFFYFICSILCAIAMRKDTGPSFDDDQTI
jgi:hypothetical protein